jgi:hypothetical protein
MKEMIMVALTMVAIWLASLAFDDHPHRAMSDDGFELVPFAKQQGNQ